MALPRRVLTAALPVGALSTEAYEDIFRPVTGTGWCEDGLWIVAAKLPFCERVLLGREGSPCVDIPRAISASRAIPGVIAPVKIDGDLYVDGGVHSPTNADLVAEEGFDEVLVISPMSTRRVARGRVNPMRVWARIFGCLPLRHTRTSSQPIRRTRSVGATVDTGGQPRPFETTMMSQRSKRSTITPTDRTREVHER